MAGTYSQIYIHIVIAVQGRTALIKPSWEEQLFKYITGIVQRQDQKMFAINGVENHIHFLVSLRPSCRISDLIREIKKASNTFVNRNKLSRYKFQWQEGYGVFSHSHSQVSNVIRYIENQKEHHRKCTFKEEYLELLRKHDISYHDDYLFDFL